MVWQLEIWLVIMITFGKQWSEVFLLTIFQANFSTLDIVLLATIMIWHLMLLDFSQHQFIICIFLFKRTFYLFYTRDTIRPWGVISYHYSISLSASLFGFQDKVEILRQILEFYTMLQWIENHIEILRNVRYQYEIK